MADKFPQYTREKLLGEGGMGKVYLAHDNQLQRYVAIKALTDQPQDEKVSLALNEARLLARVNHNNIIQIYNIIDENNQASLVMEYFKSKTLTQFQQENHLTLIQKLALLRQLSAGLAHAHNNNVVHCDLKPSNILVDDQGQVKITDFGIACLTTNSAQATTSNNNIENNQPRLYGCLQFMSPEQINQQALDYRSDIFSLGIIAYQLIVGSHPFGNGAAAKVAENICQQTPEHAKNLLLDAPSSLTDLLMAMLIKPLEERTLTASEIEHRLKHIQQAMQQAQLAEEHTVAISQLAAEKSVIADIETDAEKAKAGKAKARQTNTEIKSTAKPKAKLFKYTVNIAALIFAIIATIWFYQRPSVETKHVVVLRPTITENSLIAPMQQSLVLSAVEDAIRQAVVNTKNMYLISQRETNAIIKAYPNDLTKLQQALGASDILSTSLKCDNTRCKVSFSRLVTNAESNNKLVVKAEKSWLAPIENFNGIYSTSQTQFAALYPEHPEVNQAGLVQRPINKDDYRRYIKLYSEIHHRGNYSDASLAKLAAILTSSPYLYAAYSLYRDTALNLYIDSKDQGYFKRLNTVLNNAPPEYKYSAYEAVDRFWLASDMGDTNLANKQIIEAKNRGADALTILELEAYMFFGNGQYEQAALSYKRAFNLRPSTNLLYNTAFSYWRLGDLVEAESALNKMLETVPNHHGANQLQANIWLLQGRLSLAIEKYKKLVQGRRSSRDLTNLSLAYAFNKQYDKSLEFAQKALAINPKQPFNLLNLADIEMIVGDKELAKSHYQEVIDILIGKNEVKYLTNLAQAYGQLNQQSLAIETLNKAQLLAPKNSEVSYASTLVYSLLNEKTSAIHYAKLALENNIGVVFFNLPWFDRLCEEKLFRQLMQQYDNASRCAFKLNASS